MRRTHRGVSPSGAETTYRTQTSQPKIQRKLQWGPGPWIANAKRDRLADGSDRVLFMEMWVDLHP